MKHEYVAGKIIAMVGAGRAHNLIAGNFYRALRDHLRGTACQAFMSDMKVRIGEVFYYPDVMVDCESPVQSRDAYLSENPVLIIEVLSPSTEIRDTLEKRFTYQLLASLKEYLLVA
jgi:Uma2 family endonuclease